MEAEKVKEEKVKEEKVKEEKVKEEKVKEKVKEVIHSHHHVGDKLLHQDF